MKKSREYYNAILVIKDDNNYCMYLTDKNFKRNFKTYEEAMEVIIQDKKNKSIKNTKRTYPNGTYEYLSYNDRHDTKYLIEKHYDEYEKVYEEENAKTKSNLESGSDEMYLKSNEFASSHQKLANIFKGD